MHKTIVLDSITPNRASKYVNMASFLNAKAKQLPKYLQFQNPYGLSKFFFEKNKWFHSENQKQPRSPNVPLVYNWSSTVRKSDTLF